eukprot:scaffold2845_cov405-Pavlova_lutheri.AAC.2
MSNVTTRDQPIAGVTPYRGVAHVYVLFWVGAWWLPSFVQVLDVSCSRERSLLPRLRFASYPLPLESKSSSSSSLGSWRLVELGVRAKDTST